MTILTLQQRFNNSTIGQETLKEITEIAKQTNKTFDWSKRTNLKPTDMFPVSSIFIDDETQRPPFQSARVRKLKHIAKEPCPFHFKRVVLAKRTDSNGKPYHVVVEGQGRVLVAHALGESLVPVDIYDFNNSISDEVDFFMKQNNNVHTVTGWNKHHVLLSCPTDKLYGQACDIERVITSCNLNYDPQITTAIYDAQSCHTAIKDCILAFEPTNRKADIGTVKAGDRCCDVPIKIVELMKKYGGIGKIKLNANLFYPFTEFVVQRGGKKQDYDKAISELDQHLNNLKNKLLNKPIPQNIDIDTIVEQIGLVGLANSQRKKVWKTIKKW